MQTALFDRLQKGDNPIISLYVCLVNGGKIWPTGINAGLEKHCLQILKGVWKPN